MVDYAWVGIAVGAIAISIFRLQLSTQRNEINSLSTQIQLDGYSLITSLDTMDSYCGKVQPPVSYNTTRPPANLRPIILYAPPHRRPRDIFYCESIPQLGSIVHEQLTDPNWPGHGFPMREVTRELCDATIVIEVTVSNEPMVSPIKNAFAQERNLVCRSAREMDHLARLWKAKSEGLGSFANVRLLNSPAWLLWWYIALAYATGIRLGKVRAEVLQIRAGRRAKEKPPRAWPKSRAVRERGPFASATEPASHAATSSGRQRL